MVSLRQNDLQCHHLHPFGWSLTTCYWYFHLSGSLAHLGDLVLPLVSITDHTAQTASCYLEERSPFNLRLLSKNAGILSPFSCYWQAHWRIGTRLPHPCRSWSRIWSSCHLRDNPSRLHLSQWTLRFYALLWDAFRATLDLTISTANTAQRQGQPYPRFNRGSSTGQCNNFSRGRGRGQGRFLPQQFSFSGLGAS
jgi:hypothetical protein